MRYCFDEIVEHLLDVRDGYISLYFDYVNGNVIIDKDKLGLSETEWEELKNLLMYVYEIDFRDLGRCLEVEIV